MRIELKIIIGYLICCLTVGTSFEKQELFFADASLVRSLGA